MRGPYGESYAVAIELDHSIARSFDKILPPVSFLDSTETAIKTIRTKSYRKELFIHEAGRLGAMLAERMEDSEGWHGADRVDRATESLHDRRRRYFNARS
jgi:hypothetical protein